MAQTYLNDNMSMPYPLYGYGSTPFSMSCLIGMGICVRGDEPIGYSPVVVSNVSITKDSVNFAIGRNTNNDVFELIGTLYANTEGYSVYVPAYFYSIFSNGESICDEIEKLMGRYSDGRTVTPIAGGTQYTINDNPSNPLFSIQHSPAAAATVTLSNVQAQINATSTATSMGVYYETFVENSIPLLTDAASTGYLILGTIPDESIGLWKGQYPIDPSCITYMKESVYGKYGVLNVDGDASPLRETLTLDAGGLIGFEVKGTTVTLVPETSKEVLDSYSLSTPTGSKTSMVTTINGHAVEATKANPTPRLNLNGQTIQLNDIIKWEWARWSPTQRTNTVDTITLELNGTSNFPNCYNEV